MNRGTVMQKNGARAVVLTPDGQFLRIRMTGNASVGDEVMWTESQMETHRRRFTAGGTRWMASAAAVILLMFGLWSFRTPTVVAYVAMDINPSVEFGLDSKERVRELRAINDDALSYIQDVDYEGKPIEAVIEILARKLSESQVLRAADSEVVIASVRLKSVDAEWERQVTAKIEKVLVQVSAGAGANAAKGASLDIEKLYLPVEVREEAEANGISSGKMAFWLAAEKKGHPVALSSLKQQPLKKIASEWGGVKEVLEDGDDGHNDKDQWKKLLEDKKQKSKSKDDDKGKRNDQVTFTPSASASLSPTQAESDRPSPEPSKEREDERDSKDEKKPETDKEKREDKQKEIERQKQQEDNKRGGEDDRKSSDSGKKQDKEQDKKRDKERERDGKQDLGDRHNDRRDDNRGRDGEDHDDD